MSIGAEPARGRAPGSAAAPGQVVWTGQLGQLLREPPLPLPGWGGGPSGSRKSRVPPAEAGMEPGTAPETSAGSNQFR